MALHDLHRDVTYPCIRWRLKAEKVLVEAARADQAQHVGRAAAESVCPQHGGVVSYAPLQGVHGTVELLHAGVHHTVDMAPATEKEIES